MILLDLVLMSLVEDCCSVRRSSWLLLVGDLLHGVRLVSLSGSKSAEAYFPCWNHEKWADYIIARYEGIVKVEEHGFMEWTYKNNLRIMFSDKVIMLALGRWSFTWSKVGFLEWVKVSRGRFFLLKPWKMSRLYYS
jgi:hypothetical protein